VSTIRFNYLYRDAGNYKNWGSIVLSNQEKLPLDAARLRLRRALVDGYLFVAKQVRIPERFLFRAGFATSDDHCYHEFDGVESTTEVPDDLHSRSIAQLLSEIERESARGWIADDPHTSPAQ